MRKLDIQLHKAEYLVLESCQIFMARLRDMSCTPITIDKTIV